VLFHQHEFKTDGIPESGPQFQLRGPDSRNQQGDLRSKSIATDETFVSILLLAAVFYFLKCET